VSWALVRRWTERPFCERRMRRKERMKGKTYDTPHTRSGDIDIDPVPFFSYLYI
jgi:hypothetical protein